MQIGEIFGEFGLIIGFIIAGVVVIIAVCYFAGEVSNLRDDYRKAKEMTEEDKKKSYRACWIAMIIFAAIILFVWAAITFS